MLPDTEELVALSFILLLSWPHRNQFHNGVKGKNVLFVPCRIYFYYVVLHWIKRWERRKWVFLFSSVNCRSPRVGYFSSPSLLEDLALMVLIPPVHKTCSFLLERIRAFSPKALLQCLHPARSLPVFRKLTLSWGHDQIAALYSTCKEGRNLHRCIYYVF